jgi:kynureninase
MSWPCFVTYVLATDPPDSRFDMTFHMQPAGTASSLQISTPHLLSLVSLGASLEIFQRASITAVRTVSLLLTDRFIRRIRETLPELVLITPDHPEQRGGQVTLRHPEARRISTVLRRRHRVIADFRTPDLLRFAPVGLYNSVEEVDQAIAALREIVDRRGYEEISDTKELVT